MSNDKDELQNSSPIVLDPSKWVDKYADYLFNYVITRLNDEELARDLVQETFLAALERIDRFEGRSSERTWLTAIIKNKVIDVYRRKSSGLGNTKTNPDASHDTDFFEAEDGHWKTEHQPQEFGIDTYDPLHAKEFNHIMQQCMQKLPSLWLSIFTMKHMDGEETEHICTELKVTPSNFWVIIHRSKVNLRACLQKNWI